MEKREPVDQQRAEVLAFLAEHADLFSLGGSVQASWRRGRQGARRLGPFFRLTYRKQGTQHCIYLGKDPELAAAVRASLQELQKPLRDERELRRLMAGARAALRQSRRALDRELRDQGLHLKGNEVRGWRTARGALHTAARAGREVDRASDR